MAGKGSVPHRGQAGLAIAALAVEHQQLAKRGQSRGVGGVIGAVAQTIEHHRGVGHRRKNASEAIFAIEALGDKGDGFVDRSPPRIRRKERLGDPQQPVEHAKGHRERRGGRTADPVLHLFRRLQKELANRDPERVAGPRPLRHDDQQRHEHGARPVRHLRDVKRRPVRQQHDLDRHDRHRPPWDLAEQREQDAREHVAAPGAAARQDSRPSPLHMRRVDRIPGRLQREISLYRRADVESAPVKQRPAAVPALGCADIPGDPRLQFRLYTAEIMLEQDEFRRDRHVGLQFEDPMSVRMLQGDQRFAGSRDRLVEPRLVDATTQDRHFFRIDIIHGRARCRSCSISVASPRGPRPPLATF